MSMMAVLCFGACSQDTSESPSADVQQIVNDEMEMDNTKENQQEQEQHEKQEYEKSDLYAGAENAEDLVTITILQMWHLRL